MAVVPYPIQVNGTAVIQVSINGSNNFNTIGYSVDGVTISISNHFQDIYNDLQGPAVPCDSAYMGSDADINIRLINVLYTSNTGNDLVEVLRGISATTTPVIPAYGAQWYVGDLVLQDGLSFQLQILPSPTGGLAQSSAPCYRFHNVTLRDAHPFRVGVQHTVWDLKFYAQPDLIVSGTSYGSALFTQSCN